MSQDRISSKFGRNLIGCCKKNVMLILNGRAFLDRNIGRTTCKNSSVVGYVICSLSFLKYLTNFEIKYFCELYSDAHAPIEFSLRRMLPSNNKEYTSIAENKIKPLDESKSSNFVQDIDRSKIEELNENLLNTDNFNRDEINDIMSRIGSIFTSSAEKSSGRYRARVNTSYRNEKKNRKWFNNDCRTARRKYHTSRKLYEVQRNHNNRSHLSETSKAYKNIIKRGVIRYKREFRQKIRSMQQKSPKDYWNYINSAQNKVTNTDISIEIMYDYLKNINDDTHKAVRPGARPHVPPVMAEGDFRLMTPLYENL